MLFRYGVGEAERNLGSAETKLSYGKPYRGFDFAIIKK